MITLSYRDGNIQHFRGLSTDCTTDEEINNQIKNNSHTIPNNGDELAIMDGSQDVYLFDEQNQVWIKQ